MHGPNPLFNSTHFLGLTGGPIGDADFFAIELSSKIRRALANLVQHFVCANVQVLRLVELHNVHLGSVKTIIAQMPNELKYIRSFSLFLGRQGTFPVGDEPRVLWVGVKGNLDSLNGLY